MLEYDNYSTEMNVSINSVESADIIHSNYNNTSTHPRPNKYFGMNGSLRSIDEIRKLLNSANLI